jgi:hypothetical protein
MNAHDPSTQQAAKRTKRQDPTRRAEFLTRVVKTLTGALIGTALTSLFSLVIFAFVVKAFIASEEMSFQLLNSAITLVGTALGAVLGYYLGRSSNDPSDPKS